MHAPIKAFAISKLRHAEKMRDLRNEYPDIHFTATWPITAQLGSEAQRPVNEWMNQAELEIINSNCVFVYAEQGEILKTGLVQVGIAYTRRIPIYVIGEHTSYAEWQFDRYMVYRTPTLQACFAAMKIKFRGEQTKMGRVNFNVGARV